ncbi:MAG: chromosomal replication initiator protein DnaA [Myxococcota bacterium]
MTRNGGWEAVRRALRQRLGASAFETWFGGVEGECQEGTLVLRCPDRFTRDWIRARYRELLEQLTGESLRLEYRQDAAGAVSTRPEELPAPGSRGASRPGPDFDSFVAGPGNVLALEAARAVARGDAGRCSPLVLVGASGLGKTHLCRAIQTELGRGAVYRSSDEFTSEVTGAMRTGRMDAFRLRYRRSLNVLILEDVHFLAGRRATQVELFHTLDHLIAHDKAVVLSTSRPPHELEGLEPGLVSRMSSGLVACISPPELETRRAILREKAAGGGVRIPVECLELLASRPVQSVRDLLAGLNQVVARAALLRQPVSPELVQQALAAVELPGRPRSLDEILHVTARTYGIGLDELRGRSRRRRLVRPRQIAMYLARVCTEASLKEIGLAFGRDHSSVRYAIESVERRVAERPQLRYELEALAGRLTTAPRHRAGSAPGSTRCTRPT